MKEIILGLERFGENNVDPDNHLKNSSEFYTHVDFQIDDDNIELPEEERDYYGLILPGYIRHTINIPVVGEIIHCCKQYAGRNPNIKYAHANYEVLRVERYIEQSAIAFAYHIQVFLKPISGYGKGQIED